MSGHVLKVLDNGDSLLVFNYEAGWLDYCIISDLTNQICVGVDNIPELIKELKKFKKRSDKESL